MSHYRIRFSWNKGSFLLPFLNLFLSDSHRRLISTFYLSQVRPAGLLNRLYSRSPYAYLLSQKWVLFNMDGAVFSSPDKGILMNNSPRVINIYILIYVLHPDIGYVYTCNVHAVGAVIPIAVICFSRCKGNPCNIIWCIYPAHISRAPIDSTSYRRNPAPSNGCVKDPSTIMIRSPSPWFIGNPNVITSYPYPSSLSVWRPSRRGIN